MSKRNFVAISIFFFFVNISLSQTSKWINYTDLKTVTSIATDHFSSNIYCASQGGLFVVDNSTGKVKEKYTNLNGLINNNLTSLAIDNNRRLWVGAIDGSISILNTRDLTWKYIFDIKNSTETNKIINFLYSAGNFMFVATGYGIQKISVSNFTFIDAPYYKLGNFAINTIVYSITSNNNILYAATKSGVAYANYVSSNLNDPTSWSNYNIAPLNAEVKTIETFDNNIFAGSDGGFDYFDGTQWLPYPNSLVSNAPTKFIRTIGDNIYFISGNVIYFANRNDPSNITPFQNPDNYSTISNDNALNPISGLSDNGILIKVSGNYNFVYPNSPYTNVFSQIVIDGADNVWAAGGLPANGFYEFDGTNWTNYNIQSYPAIGNLNWFQKIAYGNGNVWALGYGGGPTIVAGNSILNFNVANSILPGISNDPNFCATYGGAYDNNGIFWLTFIGTNSSRSLYAYLGNNQWLGFINPSILGSPSLSEVAVDSYNTKWIVSEGSQKGLYFFNENGSLTNTSGYIYGIYGLSDFGSEVAAITDVIVDKNNEVWASSNNGIFIINNPLGAIQNPNQKPRPQKLGIISGNLKVPFTENCRTLTYDILNSKWIGTVTNGVFHLSSDGSTLLGQFNTLNSPILANQINSIAVSNKTGRAYFGTLNGLSSIATDAIEPVADFDEIIASPNPYLIPSSVDLKIDGLIENSTVKIITLNGEIVNEFDSPGGRIATWNGMNQQNELTPTGIYIIVAYNNDGSKVGTGKVAIVRK
jgi:TSS9, PorZ, N-terminal beta-propeller domain